VIEAAAVAQRVGLEEWLRELMDDEMESADRTTVERFITGSRRHAVRRSHEMAAAASLAADLGVAPRVATASCEWFGQLAREQGN
jgi:hypothetical protein